MRNRITLKKDIHEGLEGPKRDKVKYKPESRRKKERESVCVGTRTIESDSGIERAIDLKDVAIHLLVR